MAEPDIAEPDEGGDDDITPAPDDDVEDIGGFDDVEDDVTVGNVDLGLDDDDGMVAGFDGFDEEESSEGAADHSTGPTSPKPDSDAISEAIEDGLAELSAYGLRGQERKRVRGEMKAIASQFKIGYFGEKCVQKYLKTDLENIPPEYGLAAALVAFGAVAIYKRPDGEQKVEQAIGTLRSQFDNDEPEPEPDEPEDDTDE